MTTPTLIRRLGFGELRMHLMHSRLQGTTQGALVLRVYGALDLDRLVAAVSAVKARHELLDVVIVEHEGELWFARGSGAPADVVVRPAPPEPPDAIAVLMAENERILDSRRGLWRLAVVPHPGPAAIHDLVVVMHHAILDARGTDVLLDEVLRLATGGSLEAFGSAGPSPVPPAAETACTVTWSWEKFAQVQQEVARQVAEIGVPAHRQRAPLCERRTLVQGFALDPARSRALRERVAQLEVSLNSYVSAALLAAVRAHSPERERFALFTAVSLQRLCPSVGEHAFGCYLSVVPTFHRLASAAVALGPLALEHQQALHRSFLAYGRPPKHHPTPQVCAAFERLAEIDTFTNDIGITLAKSQLAASYGPLRVGSAYVAARRSLGNVALVLHGLELGERIFFTTSHTAPLQDGAWAAAVTHTLERVLSCAQPSETSACHPSP